VSSVGKNSSCALSSTYYQHHAGHSAKTDVDNSMYSTSDAGVTDTATDHVTSRYGVVDADELATMTSLRSSAINGSGCRMSMYGAGTEVEAARRSTSARCRSHQKHAGQHQTGSTTNVDTMNNVGYGKLMVKAFGESLQDLPDSSV